MRGGDEAGGWARNVSGSGRLRRLRRQAPTCGPAVPAERRRARGRTWRWASAAFWAGRGLAGVARERAGVVRGAGRPSGESQLGQVRVEAFGPRKRKEVGWAGFSSWVEKLAWVLVFLVLSISIFLNQTKLIQFEFKSKFEFNTNTQTNKRGAPA